MKRVPIFGKGTAGKSFVVTRQRRLNCYVELREDGDKTEVTVYGTPGMLLDRTVQGVNQPIRSMLGTQSALYVICAEKFCSVNQNGTTSFTASLSSTRGPASMAFSPTQVVIDDGIAGYLFNGSSLSIIGASFPNGARTVTFVSGFFVAEQPGSQKFWVSKLLDGSTWGGLSFASASQYSDNIVAVDNSIGNLVVFCDQHTEFWQNVGTTPQPFAPVISAVNEVGLAAIYSRAHVEQSIIFLGQTREGGVQVFRVIGYQMKAISSPDIDSIMNSFSVKADATALSYEVDSHKFYQITFTSADRSFLYDCYSDVWSEVQTGISQKVGSRHMANLSTYSRGKTYLSDVDTLNIYSMDVGTFTDNGSIVPREITTRHASSDFNEFTVDEVYLDMETGIGIQSGQGSDPQIMIQVSRDNGRTFETERWIKFGKIGNYFMRAVARRWGSARDFVFKFRMTDPVKFVVTGGSISVRERKQ